MIRNGICASFLETLFNLIAEREFKVALYSGAANVNDLTTGYIRAGEVSGPGYWPGGQMLRGVKVSTDVGSASISWDNPVWPNATFGARYALIYIWDLPGKPAVAVLDDYNPDGKDGETSARNGRFSIAFPEKLVTLALNRGA